MLDSALLSRLREVLDDQPVTETELRTLCETVDAWVRALRAQIDRAERRLDALSGDPAASLGDLADELRRVDSLLPALAEARTLHVRLEAQARRIRSAWLLQQAVTVLPAGRER
jgi:uncharacterized membrane protein YccC